MIPQAPKHIIDGDTSFLKFDKFMPILQIWLKYFDGPVSLKQQKENLCRTPPPKA